MVQPSARIIYTRTDEAPLLATYSLLPVIAAYAAKAGVDVESRDISLAGRILALFPERLTEDQQVADALAELGELAKSPEANIIKLPNVSASIPQLKAAIRELQQQGFDLPDYPDDPQSDDDAVRALPLRQGQGLRGQPRAAGGQLRPPRAAVGEELRPQAPALDGRLEQRLQDQRRAHGRRRLPLQREVGRDPGRHDAEDHPGRRRRCRDGAARVGARSGRRGRRLDRDASRRVAGVPDRADRPGQGRGRAAVGPPQGDHDEGLGPDHLRPRGEGLPARGVRHLRRPRWPPRVCRPTTDSAASWPASTRCRRGPRSRPPSIVVWPTARRWPWSTPTEASPTCTCRPTSSWTPRCRP